MTATRKLVVHNEADTELVEQIERLAKASTPIKAAARMLGIDRRLVRKVYHGKHTSQRMGKRHRRCPGCGGKQKFPCGVCAARQARPTAA